MGGAKSGMKRGFLAPIRGLAALMIGSSFVGLIVVLGHHNVATPIPFVVLSPGILAGALVPGSGFNPEGDIHRCGFFSTLVVFAVDVAIYGGLVYLFLNFLGWLRKGSN
jgi:hypothetical protein